CPPRNPRVAERRPFFVPDRRPLASTGGRPICLESRLRARVFRPAAPSMVPHLITALTGPINELEQRMLESLPAIERWFRLEWMEHTPPFYTSVDLRNAGFKLAPVDTNLFPGGFNNMTPEMLPLAVQAAMAAI